MADSDAKLATQIARNMAMHLNGTLTLQHEPSVTLSGSFPRGAGHRAWHSLTSSAAWSPVLFIIRLLAARTMKALTRRYMAV